MTGCFRITCMRVSVSCTFIMITCYSIMAAALLKKNPTLSESRRSVKRDAIYLSVPSSQPGTSHRLISKVNNAALANDPGPSNISTKVKPNVQGSARKSVPATATNKIIHVNHANTLTNVLMLFIISTVFIARRMPMWLAHMDVYISTEIRRSMITHSVVKPFIYGVASAQFREDVRQFYRQTRIKLSLFYN